MTALDAEELSDLKNRLIPYLEQTSSRHGVDMLFFMLTNIVEESTELIFYGENSASIVERAFHIELEDEHSCQLEEVVSRKKQVIPALVTAVQK